MVEKSILKRRFNTHINKHLGINLYTDKMYVSINNTHKYNL